MPNNMRCHRCRPAQVTVMHNTINEGSIVRLPKGDARGMLKATFVQIKGKKVVLYVGRY